MPIASGVVGGAGGPLAAGVWAATAAAVYRQQQLRRLGANACRLYCSASSNDKPVGSGDGDGSSGGDGKPANLLKRIWHAATNNANAEGASEGAAGAAAGGASDGAAGAANGHSETKALVPSGPERRHHRVFVVELGRKPLFPGIYTPVMIQKNERLVRELTDLKKMGAQAYVGAFLRRPDGAGAFKTEDAKAAAEDAAAQDAAAAGGGGAAGAGGRGDAAGSKAGTKEVVDPMSHLYDVGTFAQVHTIVEGDTSDSTQLLLLGHRRVRRTGVVSQDPLKVHVEHLRDENYENTDILKATSMEIVNTMRDLLLQNPLYGEQFRTLMSLTGSIDLQDTSRLVDAAASLTSADDATLQSILAQLSVPERANAVLLLLKKEVELCKLQQDIREQVETKIMKEQRRMLLMEQLKSIKKELGLQKDDKTALLQRFQDRWAPKKDLAPPDVQKVVQEELDKLNGLESTSPEFNVTRSYLDWLTVLPWGSYSKEVFDVAHARKVLDDDHFGLDDVKERILEFIAVGLLKGTAHGKILCLVGPPGVGKTSIGRSIATTLNRKYFRFSVGGLYDVAEIKGHRRTYVGAMPGKMVQCLKATASSNPLVLIDEIDKLGRGHAGDPASALLELLDPEQNASFLDHYLDVPIDLSKVLFVCTANVLDTIPGPLLDRMEVIRIAGYASEEKRHIARRYLEPQACADAGVPKGAANITDGAMIALIDEYCREAGVRNLKKHIEKLYRKVALRIVKAQEKQKTAEHAAAAAAVAAEPASSSPGDTSVAPPSPASSSDASSSTDHSTDHSAADHSVPSSSSSRIAETTAGATGATAAEKGQQPDPEQYTGEMVTIDLENLKDFVGPAPYSKDRFYDVTPPGVVMGLAWTALGGATLYVEAARIFDGSEAYPANSSSGSSSSGSGTGDNGQGGSGSSIGSGDGGGQGRGGGGGLTTTGQLGDVFRESTHIAHTYARAFLGHLEPKNRFFSKSMVHVHVPSGATPKDGPSAGVTVVTALLSLALNKPVRPDLAMTGEVTLTGRVLPIGGVKEKVLAARRSNVHTVVFPKGNQRDWDVLPDDLKQGLDPHFVSHYDQVFQLALKYDQPEQQQQGQQQPAETRSSDDALVRQR